MGLSLDSSKVANCGRAAAEAEAAPPELFFGGMKAEGKQRGREAERGEHPTIQTDSVQYNPGAHCHCN
jgi:hypothetical protein